MPIDFYFERTATVITFIETDGTRKETDAITPNERILGRGNDPHSTVETSDKDSPHDPFKVFSWHACHRELPRTNCAINI